MNRHIKHWFRLYAKDFNFCKSCRSLPDHMEISDDNSETFPDGVVNLQHLGAIKLPYTCDGSFMQCYKCKFYYWYRSFAPGGSEDAMRTVNYETISKMGLLGVYMELKEALEVSSVYYKKYKKHEDKILYDMYCKEYMEFDREAQKHLAYINDHSAILIKDAFVCLKAHASAKDNKYYVVDLIPAEEEASLILLEFVKRAVNQQTYKEALKTLVKHPNEKVAALIKNYLK